MQTIDRQKEARENLTVDPAHQLEMTFNKLVATTKPKFKICR